MTHARPVAHERKITTALEQAFIERSTRALAGIAHRLDADTLQHAVSASSDIGTLARAVVGDLFIELVGESDEDVAERFKEQAYHQELVERAGGLLSATQVAKLLNITRQAVDKRRRNMSLLAIRTGSDWRYPAAQFHKHETIPYLQDVTKGHEHAGPWITLEFLVTPRATLRDKTAYEALIAGGDTAQQVLQEMRGQERMDGFG